MNGTLMEKEKMRTLIGESKSLIKGWGGHQHKINELMHQVRRRQNAIRVEIATFIRKHLKEFTPEIVIEEKSTKPEKMFAMAYPFSNYYFDEYEDGFYIDTNGTVGGALHIKVVRRLNGQEHEDLLNNQCFIEDGVADCFKTHDA